MGACVHGASLAEKGAHRAPTPRKPCLPPCPSSEGPWGCLHATSMGAEGMERLWPWDGCFACSHLPCMREHPCSPASYGWKYRLREPSGGCTMEDAPVQEPWWMVAWHRLSPGALNRHTNHSESKSKCFPSSIDRSRGLCVPRC